MCGTVDIVLAYFITTRLWYMQNCIIHNHNFHQRSNANYLSRYQLMVCVTRFLTYFFTNGTHLGP